ncbi:MAG: glycosyltransferase family 39 protein [Leptospira sp.]|nr:glycosyltransferase family 39 protein [Leptospira sp.]
MDSHTLWMPPVFMISLSGIFFVFPATLFTARMFSSILALLSVYILVGILKNLKFSGKIIAFSILLIASDFLFIRIHHSSRMESSCLFFSLLTIYCLTKNIDSSSLLPVGNIFLAGIFLGLSFLAHPFGAVFAFVATYILFERSELSMRNFFVIGAGGILPLIGWAFYVIPNWDLFVVQFGAQFARKSELFSAFSQIAKIKIILSSFRFPVIKFLITALIFGTVFYRRKELSQKFGKSFRIFAAWFFIILGFIYLSTESWYVVYLVFPLSLITALLVSEKLKFSIFAYSALTFNVAVLLFLLINHFIILETPKKTNEFFTLIEQEIVDKKFIYLQSIPDPYFYLRKKYPDKKILEFIPGELSLPGDYFRETIGEQDAFFFYNEDLMNSHIREYLEQNKKKFERKVIRVDTGGSKDLRLEGYLYVKK